MASDELLRERAEQYDIAIDKMLDALQATDDEFGDAGIGVVMAMTAYARALNDASKTAQQEIAEHYAQLARNLHVEIPFLIAKLTKFRERRSGGQGAVSD